jgi:hypothetical protein
VSGWLDGYGPEPQGPPPQPAKRPAPNVWKKGQRRVLVEALCCEDCGWLKLRRREEYGAIAYWQCEACAHRQKDDLDAGRERAHLA